MDIIKSLIFPRFMKRYRYMSVFIALAIFVLTVYLLCLPFQITNKNSKDKFIADDVLSIKAFAEINDPSFDFSAIKSAEYTTNSGKLVCNYPDDGAYRYYKTQYTMDDKLMTIHLVFDPYNSLEKSLEALKEDYLTAFILEGADSTNVKRRAAQIANLTYVQMLIDPILNPLNHFAILHNLTDQALDEEAAKVSNFSYFNITPTKDKPEFILLFTSQFVEYQIPLFDKEGNDLSPQETLATLSYGESMKIDVKEMNSISDLGNKFARNIIDLYLQYSLVQYTLQAILIVIIYPLLIVLILWLFFRKNGELKTFKEYYNIAAISSLLPTIISFIVLWFYPTMITIFGLILSVFYIFNLYRINLIPKEV